MQIGVFLPNWVGDLAMATPALRAVRDHFPQARISGILRPYLADVLAGTDLLDELVPYDPRGRDRRHRGWRLARSLRQRQLDTALLLTNSLRSAALAWAARARTRVGYVRNGRGWLLTHQLHAPHSGRRRIPYPTLDSYLTLAAALGCPTPSRRIELATLPADEAAADAVWKKFDFGGQPVAVLNSSGAYGAAKLWPSGAFAALARRLADEKNLRVLLLCGPSERELARDIAASAAHPRVQSLADEPLGIGLSKACVRRARLLVTTDSGPRHFAAAFGTPVVTIFGPTHIAWSETYCEHAAHVQHAVDCGPCQRRVCPLGHHRCMRELSVETVMATIEALLERVDRQAQRAA